MELGQSKTKGDQLRTHTGVVATALYIIFGTECFLAEGRATAGVSKYSERRHCLFREYKNGKPTSVGKPGLFSHPGDIDLSIGRYLHHWQRPKPSNLSVAGDPALRIGFKQVRVV